MQAQNFVRQTLQRFARHLGLLLVAFLLCVSNSPSYAQNAKDEQLKEQCRAGNGKSCMIVGLDLIDMGHAYGNEAMIYYELGCKFNNSISCHNAATELWNGFSVAKDHPKALYFWQRGCALKEQDDCDSFAAAKSIAQDEPTRDACDAGDPQACLTMGNKLINIGEFDGPKATAAMQFWNEGCDFNKGSASAQACNNAGMQYWSGKRVSENKRKAITEFEDACDRGNKEGCANKARTEHYFDQQDRAEKVAGCKSENAAYVAQHGYTGFTPNLFCGF